MIFVQAESELTRNMGLNLPELSFIVAPQYNLI